MADQSAPAPNPRTWRQDLYQRLTSRKFLLTVLTALTIIAAWARGSLPPQWAAAAVTAVTVVYVLVEGFIDASAQ